VQIGSGSGAYPSRPQAGFLSHQQQLLARQLAQPVGLPLNRLTPLQSQQVQAAPPYKLVVGSKPCVTIMSQLASQLAALLGLSFVTCS